MNQTILHYVYDPLCGWCYGAAPLLKAARQMNLPVVLHAGGLWIGAHRQPMGTALRDYVRPHDQRIEALTGQHFGERYFEQLLLDERLELDSEPPIRAILAVQASGGDPLAMLHRLQETHYRDGLWIGEMSRLVALAQEVGVEEASFRHAYVAAPLAQHLAESQQWLQRIGSQGYPSLALERQGQLVPLAASAFLGQAAEFSRQLASLMSR